MSFASLGLSGPILDAVAGQGYDKPTPIQLKAIPAILDGKDVMAAAQTGTGKTAGFTLPILERLSTGARAKPNQARTLILTPTRELALQVSDSVKNYGANMALRSTEVYGGVKINPQITYLRKGVDVLVATPGRLLDLYNQNAVRFDSLEILVLDEADRMLDMGFINDIRKILSFLPARRQNLMFSATFSDEIRKLAKGIVHNPVEISVSPKNTTAANITQWVYPVDKSRKTHLLTHLIKENGWHQVLVFARTRHGSNRLARTLAKQGIKSAAIHGDRTQGQRVKALAAFKSGKVQVLVATDIAARGLDIDKLPHVVNFDLPSVPADYIHRIGRTGRAGSSGQAVSLVSADEFKQLSDIERLIKRQLERKLVDGFEPDHNVPASRPLTDSTTSGAASSQKPGRSKKASRSRSRGRSANQSSRHAAADKSANAPSRRVKKRKPAKASNPAVAKNTSRSDKNKSDAKQGTTGLQTKRRKSSKSRRNNQSAANDYSRQISA